MNAPLERLAADIDRLSLDDQIALMERLARRIRERTRSPAVSLDDALTAMANDPDIQRELRAIEAEFTGTESDGLSGKQT